MMRMGWGIEDGDNYCDGLGCKCKSLFWRLKNSNRGQMIRRGDVRDENIEWRGFRPGSESGGGV